jgi:hypothetical protein
MKKTALFLLVAFVAFQAAAFAGTVEGTVVSVDAAGFALALTTDAGPSSVSYSDTTTWPEGVTDPASLVDKQVKIATDDVTGAAVSVEEVAATTATM